MVYDLIIIGAGPGGLTAALYASRSRLSTLILERAAPGGQIVNADRIEDFPGFPDGVSGIDLSQYLLSQATKFDAQVSFAEALGVVRDGGLKIVATSEGEQRARAIIVASGADVEKLGVPGEETFLGRGVSHCATCDGAFFRDQPVAVVGGGNIALMEALYLADMASQVYLIHHQGRLEAQKVLQDRASSHPRIRFLGDTHVEAVEGEDGVKSVALRNGKTGARSSCPVSGIFIYRSFRPNTAFLKDVLTLDASGHIPVGRHGETEATGIFAVGDVCRGSSGLAITAAGEGAVAALQVEKHLV